MKTENLPAEAIKKFREKYPLCTSADLQTFALGYEAAMNDSQKMIIEIIKEL